MTELSPKARAIVEAGRNPQVFTGTDRERIRRGVRLRLTALGAVTTTAGTAIAMSPATKIVLVTVAATLLGGGAISFWALREPAPGPSAAVPQSSGPKAPAPATPPAVSAAAAGAAATSGDAEKSNGLRRAGRRSPTDTRKTVPPLDAELTVLRQAREDLRAGRPGNAYQSLSEYDRRYGDGPLAQERQAVSAIALCQWRPGAEAQTRAADFLRDRAESPLANRVRAACKQTTPAAP